MLRFSLWKQYVKPYLLSVELGPPIRCALVSLSTSCSTFHALWEEAHSSPELVIAHDLTSISFYGRVSLPDFQTYISAALRAIVIHPFRLVMQDIARLPELNDLRQQIVPGIFSRAQNYASITIAADFVFEHESITEYVHVLHPRFMFMGIQVLCSTSHWIYATCNGVEVKMMDLCLAIGDIFDEGVHTLYAQEPAISMAMEPAYARKVARINALFFGLPKIRLRNKSCPFLRSCIAVEWSDEIWQPQYIDGHEPSHCKHACVGAAIRKANQDGTDLVVSALVQVQLAMQDNDNGMWLPITSLRVAHESLPSHVES